MCLSGPAVNTSLYVHCALPWAQPCGRLSPCKSSILTICYLPLMRKIVLQGTSKPVKCIILSFLIDFRRGKNG